MNTIEIDDWFSYVFKKHAIEINADDFSEATLPEHLKINYRVVGAENEILEQGKELALLKNKLSSQVENAFTELYESTYGAEEVRSWDFGELPLQQVIKTNGNSITIYPSLIEEEGKVYRYAFDNPEAAQHNLRYGLRGLLKNRLLKEIKYLRKNLRNIEKLALLYSKFASKEELIDSIINLVLDETFLYEGALIRKQDHFLAKLEQGRYELIINADKICVLLQKILETYMQIQSLLSEKGVIQHSHAVSDIEDQLEYMIFNGFIDDVQMEYLNQYPRYLDAILKRLDKLAFAVEKDRQYTVQINEHWNRIMKLVDNAYETDGFTKSLIEYRWMIEELRISLFTQGLKTRVPVSIKRLDKMWEKNRNN